MPLILAILSLLLLLFGGVAAVVGWRGKRLDDHPVCRRCRFDLTGSPEPRLECAECGAALDEPKAIRIGNRRRRTGWVVAGVTSILLGGACIAILASGIDFNPYKPFWLLRMEATSPTLGSKGGALLELLKLAQRAALSSSEEEQLMQSAVAMQASQPQTWDSNWTQLFWLLQGRGVGTKEQHQQFIRDGIQLQLHIRERVETDENIPVRISAEDSRVATKTKPMLVKFDAGTVRLTGIEEQTDLGVPDMSLRGTRKTLTFDLRGIHAPDDGDWPAGHWPITIDVDCTLYDESLAVRSRIMSLDLHWTTQIEIVRDGDAPIILYEDKTLAESVQAAWSEQLQDRLVLLKGMPMHEGGFPMLGKVPEIPGAMYAYRILARSGEEEWELAELFYPDTFVFYRDIRDLDANHVDVVFRPAPEIAKKTTHIDRILDHEFVIKDVEVVWEEPSRTPAIPLWGDTR